MSLQVVIFYSNDSKLIPYFMEDLRNYGYMGSLVRKDEDWVDVVSKGKPPIALVVDNREVSSPQHEINYHEKLNSMNLGHIPIIMLLSRSNLNLQGVKCSDFLIFDGPPQELPMRIENALVRKGMKKEENVFSIGDFSINFSNWVVRRGSETIELTFKEFELLRLFVTHRDQVFTREDLLYRIWGLDYYGGVRTVDVHIRRLRQKLAPTYDHIIQTVRNVGYSFNPNL